MAKKYLDYDGLLYFWQKIKANFVTDVTYNSTSKKIQKTKAGSTSDVVTLSTVATSGSYNDLSNKPTIPIGVEPTTTTPKMDGTATVGTETKFARGDHVHPTDTSRASTDDLDNLAVLVDVKVDKVTGKGLSTNDYTTDEKNKLAGIAAGAEVNVQSDWSQTTTTADDFIKNKPSIPSAGTGSSYPTMDGTKSLGSQAGYARVDHVHPSDTSRVPTTRKVNNKALSSDITLWARDIDVDTDGQYYSDANINEALVAIDNAIDDVERSVGQANGICPLDANSRVSSIYLPSYVDDVIEAYPRSGQTELSQSWLAKGSAGGTVITPEAGKIYVLMADSTSYSANSQFRWGGTAYVKMNDGGVSSITNAEIDTIVAS